MKTVITVLAVCLAAIYAADDEFDYIRTKSIHRLIPANVLRGKRHSFIIKLFKILLIFGCFLSCA